MKKQYGYMLFKRYVRFIMDQILFRHHYILGREKMPKDVEPFIVPLDNNEGDGNDAIDKPTVNRKKDESEP